MADFTFSRGWAKTAHLEGGGEDFYIDLLFYHLRLHCYVALELKTGPFKPEYAGKLNFYLTTLDEQVKMREDQPSIGLILCKNRNTVIAEYAFRDVGKPIGIARYAFSASLPEVLEKSLPTAEEVEAELGRIPPGKLARRPETRRILPNEASNREEASGLITEIPTKIFCFYPGCFVV